MSWGYLDYLLYLELLLLDFEKIFLDILDVLYISWLLYCFTLRNCFEIYVVMIAWTLLYISIFLVYVVTFYFRRLKISLQEKFRRSVFADVNTWLLKFKLPNSGKNLLQEKRMTIYRNQEESFATNITRQNHKVHHTKKERKDCICLYYLREWLLYFIVCFVMCFV